jgi:hypothetical protein
MGWTYRNKPEYLRLYPEYAMIPALLERWPALRVEAEKMRAEGLLEGLPKPVVDEIGQSR